MPADQQVAEVTAKLLELNPAFDGKVTPRIQDGVVTDINFSSKAVGDISALRALTRLKVVQCNGVGSPLKDFTPLVGMQLTKLDCIGTSISDLTQLSGLPLRTLNLNKTKVTDLSPLRGMPLTFLLIDDTKVTDLSPLHDCKQLTRLNFLNTKVKPAQVAELQMALPQCSIKWNDPAEAKAKAKAKSKSPSSSQASAENFSDPSLESWMRKVVAMSAEEQGNAVAAKLKELNPGFDGKLSFQIRNEVVNQLRFSTREVSNLSPLYALKKLEFLNCGGSPGRVEKLTPLAGMPLKILFVNGSEVSDLSPLSGMRLSFLGLSRSKVSDLSPLRGMPLIYLNCDGTPVGDLSPLRGCQSLKTLSVVDTQVTLEGIAALKKALPDCEIKSK